MQNYRLFYGLPCGTNTHKIYEEFAEKFGWDKWQSNQFGKQGLPLYARNATPEGYNVWCIGHSNWTKEKRKDKKKDKDWDNVILNNAEQIDEYWQDIQREYGDFMDLKYRVVFAKKKDGYYYFLGVYELAEKPDLNKKEIHNGKSVWVRRYRRISENYPVNT